MNTIPPHAPATQAPLLQMKGASLESLTTGLLAGRTTAKSLAELHGMTPKQFHKALRNSTFGAWTDWLHAALPLCQSTTGISALITDDTVVGHPSGRVLPLGKVLFHQKWKRPLYAQNLVALAWTDGTRVILLGLRPWVPDSGVTKHQLLEEMLEEVISGGLKADWLLFDGWYLRPELVYWCAKHRIHWASRLRRDRIVETDKGPIEDRWEYRADELAAAFAEREYRWYPEFRKYAKGVELTTRLSPRPLKVALVKDHYHDNLDAMRFWACSAPVDVPTILRLVKLRWGIEVAFRYLKQHLGLEKCIIRTPHILTLWWNLLWSAYNTVASGQTRRRNWSTAKIHLLAAREPHATMHSAYVAA